jgi:hypothetical protein
MVVLPSVADDGSFTIIKATLLLREKLLLPGNDAVMEIVIWQLPRMLPGSRHRFKYRLALVVSGECVVRYDNETGKDDHKHIGEREVPYEFADLDTLLRDFRADVAAWRT